jgi:hypothetical protein
MKMNHSSDKPQNAKYRIRVRVSVMVFQQYFSYIVTVSFIGGVNQSTRRKPPTCRKSLTNFITSLSLSLSFSLNFGYMYYFSIDLIYNYTLYKNAGFWLVNSRDIFLQIQALHCELSEFLLHVGVFAYDLAFFIVFAVRFM